MFKVSYTTNYTGGTEEDHVIPMVCNIGAIEDIVADVLDDPLVSSVVFTIARTGD